MERERPEYLAPLKPADPSFPWLAIIGLTLGAAMIGGIGIYLKTVVAWESNNHGRHAPQHHTESKPAMTTEQLRLLDETRAARERYLRDVEAERKTWKCIQGTPFRPLKGGGWENVPGESC